MLLWSLAFNTNADKTPFLRGMLASISSKSWLCCQSQAATNTLLQWEQRKKDQFSLYRRWKKNYERFILKQPCHYIWLQKRIVIDVGPRDDYHYFDEGILVFICFTNMHKMTHISPVQLQILQVLLYIWRYLVFHHA